MISTLLLLVFLTLLLPVILISLGFWFLFIAALWVASVERRRIERRA